ncbi:MAG TPA: hypothetical protein DEP35_14040 [Deltaproteobacteria bacterium]|nr:hypothetical protein [Deltaproteobacteria bacterium]
MILSKRMADHKPHDMICELVDNAFDADAKRVWIELARRSLTVGDDGSGMEDVNDAIRFGKGTSAGRRGSVLGRYGVGMTDALCKLGPKAEITTLRSGELRRLRVDWEECLRNDHFPYLDEGRPQRTRELTLFEGVHVSAGTRVHIHGQAPGLQLDRLCRLLTERYTPGIWEDRQIFVRREDQDWLAIEDMDPGPLSDAIEYDGEIDGMNYHVYGGLMTRRNVVYNRTFIGYAYRFVEDTTELFKGISTAHLQVFLGEQWKECLGTHKTRLERKREELFEDIRSRAKEWLSAAASKAEALQLRSLALELKDYLEKTAAPIGKDAVASVARGAGRRDNRRRGDGSASSRDAEGSAGENKSTKPRRGIQIAWDSALRQMGELRVSGDGEIVVALNPDDPRIRVLRERRDCPGLVHIISAYVAQYAALHEENAKRVLRAGIVRAADPGLQEHELYAHYYDRVDQPAVAHEGE